MRKSPVASICRNTLNLFDEIVVDNFAGGGGASTGIEMALGRSPEIAINHDPDAISMHTVNHPTTEHYCESVWDIVPRDVVAGRPVGLVWLSPDCKHFSKAKGSTPVSKKIRGLAWVTLRWAATVHPRVIMLENVEEFQTWGPLLIDSEGNARPDPAKKGRTFNSFINALRRQGYKVEWRELRACDYGTPTIRKRLFLIARRDGAPIVWPKPTHGDPAGAEVKAGMLKYYGTDSTIPCSEPLHTVTTRDRFGLVTVRGEDYQIVDIGMRMLEPHELFAAQGFPADYVIDHDATGKRFTKTAQVARCGNAVCPPLAAALVRANLPEMCADAQVEAA